MKNYKSSLIALSVLLALGLLYLMLNPAKKIATEQEEKRLQILNFNPELLRGIQIASGEQTVKLSRQTAWMITEPKQVPVDEGERDFWLKALSQLKALRWVSDDESDTTKFGFNAPSLKITLEFDGQPNKELLIGSRSNVANEYFATIAGDKNIYMLDNTLLDRARRPWEVFRNRKILNFSADDVASLEINGPRQWRADRSGKVGWTIATEGQSITGDPDKIMRLLSGLRALRAEQFALDGATAADLHKFGLAPPYLTVRLKTTAGEESILAISKPHQTAKGRESVYVITRNGAFIYEISAYFVEKFTSDPSEYAP